MKFSLLATAAAAVLAFGSAAQAAVITFDDLPALTHPADGYGGLNWSAYAWTINHDCCGASGYENGNVSRNNELFSAYGYDISFSSATPFALTSLYLTAAWNEGLNVDIVGKLGGVTKFSTTRIVGTSAPTLESFGWSNIDEVDFHSYGGQGCCGNHFVIDNLTIGGAVPEPATWALMIAGFGLAGAALRRRKLVLA